jgi:V8-like Glu-specific endopeptidase
MESSMTKLVGALVLAASCTACDQKPYDGQPYCGDVKTATGGIINGVDGFDPVVVPLTDAQASAVGMVEIGGTSMCTGAVVGPSTVLTAAHCLRSSPPWIKFHVGRDWRSPLHTYDSTSWDLHPDYTVGQVAHDLAVVHLTRDPQVDGVGVLNPHVAPVQSLAGQMVQAVGYGHTSYGDSSNSLKWWVVLEATSETATAYIVSGDGTTGTCDGDSGGPLLWKDPAAGVGVYGVLSMGVSGTACLGDSHYTRLDETSNSAFLVPYLPSDPCSGETLQGRCADASTAIWCQDGSVTTDVCDPGESCQATIDGLMRCVALGACEAEGLDALGVCTGDGHARWCEDGVVRDRDCALCGQACGWTGDTLGNYCM